MELHPAKSSKNRGFTLLELLVVIGIIGILAAIVIVAINPGRQFAQARNAQRWNDVNATLNAIHQYAVDNNGIVPATITATPTNIGSGGSDIDLCESLVGEVSGISYITAMPVDPENGNWSGACTSYNTSYLVSKDVVTGRVTIDALSSELGTSIKVER
ncbi:type II secretion system protein [Patescibacteria group bacterium]|nr:type II secretion system protein [Patescibacteria group bacterium]